jgi:hypothetical protein
MTEPFPRGRMRLGSRRQPWFTARPSESEKALDARVADSRNLIVSAWRVIAGCWEVIRIGGKERK